MNSFAVLADDVEDVDDLAPKSKLVEEQEEEQESEVISKATSGKKGERRDGKASTTTNNNKTGKNNSAATNNRSNKDRRRDQAQTENGATNDEHEEEEQEKKPEEPADMSLDEYLAQKKADARVELRKTGVGRKANQVGGKMAKLKKGENEDVQETSIMSAVSLKEKANERAVKDSTQTAVAHNAKNQEFFRNTPGMQGRSYNRGRGRGRGGYGRGREYRNRYEGRRNVNVVQSPNVDDPTAFPSLSA